MKTLINVMKIGGAGLIIYPFLKDGVVNVKDDVVGSCKWVKDGVKGLFSSDEKETKKTKKSS